MNLRDHDRLCNHPYIVDGVLVTDGWFTAHEVDGGGVCPGGRVPTQQEINDTLSDVIQKRIVEAFLGTLTEIDLPEEIIVNEWPEYAALVDALRDVT